MPDQYDPKVSPRPSADRRQSGRGGVADDPLAELAKIVQGRPTGGPLQATRQVAPAAPAAPATADLEAELLNDLQASFAAVRDVFPTAAPAPAPVAKQPAAPPPAPLQMRPAVAEERNEIPEPAPPPPAPPPRQETHPELRDEFRLEPIDETRLVPIPTAPVIQPMIQSSAEPAPPTRTITRPAEPPPAAEKPAAEPAVERPSMRPRTPPAAPDLGAFQLRGSAAPSPATAVPAATPARQPHSRWERPEPTKAQPAAASRFAPPRTSVPPLEEEAELDPFAEGGLFADSLEVPEVADDDFPLEDLGTLPGYADDEQLPPLEDDLDPLPARRGVSRNLVIIAAVVLVALVGGVGFAMFNGSSGTGGAPPTITADGKPTKITPDDTTAANDTDGQNKLIYDRVNSSDQANNNDTTLLTPDNGPIKDVASNTGNGAISRVIIPGGPGIDAPGTGDAAATNQQATTGAAAPSAATDPVGQLAANDAAAATDAASIQPIGPRKVRTVVVKPNGAIVYSTSRDADPAADLGATTPPAATDATKPATDTAAKPAVTDDVAAISGTSSDALPITAPPADGTAAPAATVDATPPAATTATPPANTTPPAATAAAKPAATKPAAKPAAKPDPTDVADDGATPIDIVPGATAAAATSGVLVQISSQRTEDAARATYRDLQARYPNILGSYDVNIQRADVPDRGTFYRVRVGPFSQGDAQRLCDDLRQAGGDCVLAKR
ncbi:MAG TPA: SPOR domain-containing protein [Bauldia sp.]|nr:SPOR domain-containing protein [Bauldia sp.]